jgi:hypothetical protein
MLDITATCSVPGCGEGAGHPTNRDMCIRHGAEVWRFMLWLSFHGDFDRDRARLTESLDVSP